MSELIPFSFLRARWLVLFLAICTSGCDLQALSSLLGSRGEGVSVLTLLDTDRRRLEIGDDIQGTLSASDYVGVNESYLDAWALKGKPGQQVSIDLVSDDFDAYLYVVGPGLSETLRDDDSGGACHSRIDFTILERGVFQVVASSSGSGQTGTYRIRVSEEPRPREAMSCGGIDGSALSSLSTAGREIRWGDVSQGRLTGAETSIQDGRPVQAWALQGSAGETVTIRLESDDYDAYLYLFGPGLPEALTDDDGAGSLDSELTVTFPETGTYTIGAGALTAGATGAYTLSVLEPVDLATMSTDDRVLRIGSNEAGFLTRADPIVEGKPVQAWAFEARAGDRVTIDLISDDFDSYLHVAGPGLMQPLTNDDGGGDLHSRLDVTFPDDGVYRVIASSLGGSTGSFTLTVR